VAYSYKCFDVAWSDCVTVSLFCVCWSRPSSPAKNGLTDRKAVCDVDSDGPRKPRIRSLSRSSHGKGVSSPLEIIVIFCCTADGSPLLFPSAVFPIGVSEQFLNGTSAHNRPFQCHIPIGRSHVKFSPSRNLPHAMRPVLKLL